MAREAMNPAASFLPPPPPRACRPRSRPAGTAASLTDLARRASKERPTGGDAEIEPLGQIWQVALGGGGKSGVWPGGGLKRGMAMRRMASSGAGGRWSCAAQAVSPDPRLGGSGGSDGGGRRGESRQLASSDGGSGGGRRH